MRLLCTYPALFYFSRFPHVPGTQRHDETEECILGLLSRESHDELRSLNVITSGNDP